MTDWWQGIPTAETAVACGGAQHRLRWEDGALRLPDHDDVEGERALAALANERNACVEAADRWHRQATNERVLVLASRGPSDPLHTSDDESGAGGGLTAYGIPALPGQPGASGEQAPDEEEDLLALLSLGGGLADRLTATVAAHWAAKLEAGDCEASVLAALEAALYGRLTTALRSWLGESKLNVEIVMTTPDSVPTLTREGATIQGAFPFSWLTHVWSRGFATALGRFCIDASTSPGDNGWTLTTVTQDLARIDTITMAIRSAAGSPP